MTDKQRTGELLAKLGERPLDDGERQELCALLARSPEALDHYLDHCEIETWLAAAGSLTADEPAIAVLTTEVPVEIPEKVAGKWPRWAAVAAAPVLVGTSLLFLRPGADETVATAPNGETETASPSEEAAASGEGGLAARAMPGGDPSKIIASTGAVNHPGLGDAAMPRTAVDRPVRFNRDIRPILSEACFSCHGPDDHGRRADLRLDLAEGATADLGGYRAIAPGRLADSEAWARIVSQDADELMPPPESHLALTDEQKQLIRRWIEEGAEYEGHWAFQAPDRPVVPEFKAPKSQIRNPIDAFVLARLEEEGMAPSPEADPRILIRRLNLDLLGLPPTLEEVERFAADYRERGEEAWRETVDRLLDSPHFGERMALPWLDQSRYADTNGYSIDGGRDMWLWRDWVIHAYNRNLPFDRFVVEQLAGDLLPDATEAQRVATGFNRNHMITHEGGTIPEENLTNYAADRVQTAGEVFLGLTMACAQCHDHKYDPISIKEYYEFFAFFNELSDKGLDGNSGINAVPAILASTVLPTGEVAGLEAELAQCRAELTASEEGFVEWLAGMRAKEAKRGEGFERRTVEMLDVSSPNQPGHFEFHADGQVVLGRPARGLNAFSHAMRLPAGRPVEGIRIRFFPYLPEGAKEGAEARLTPHPDGLPKVTTVLVSAGEQPAKQVDFHRQLVLAQATASSSPANARPDGILDERNLHWWEPVDPLVPQHLTVTFAEPVDPASDPYLTVMIFYGLNDSMPFHWSIEAFSGADPDSVFPTETAEALARPESEWSEAERALVMEAFRARAPQLERLRIRIANLSDRIEALTRPHSTMVMDTAEKPRQTHVLDRGQYDMPLEKVLPGTPRVLPPLAAEGEKATRLDLARWLVQPDHPLTARVAVNRLWALFFGTGLVATSADFGSQGEWPSHPELLDWLATEFTASGWDQKTLVRRIVGSATYRQDSSATPAQLERDPRNRLLGRGPRFRLPAEFVRDQALATSGLLVPRIGGPSVQPYQPPGLWKEVSHFGSTPATKQVFVQDRGEKLYRRSLYTIVKRTSPHPAMSAFDAPNREMCIVQRGVTNTPLQALVTLNDPQFAEAARVFAAKLLRETIADDETARLRTAFARVTGREPSDSELGVLDSFLRDESRRYRDDPAAARQLVAVGEFPLADDLDPAEQAVWTQVAALLFNLSETLSRL